MARRPRLFAGGFLYHVIVRGSPRQNTCVLDGDDHREAGTGDRATRQDRRVVEA